MLTLTIDGKTVDADPAATLLRVALAHEIYIPTLCFHPDLPPAEECGLCTVEIAGRGPVRACTTPAEPGLIVQTLSDALTVARRSRLAEILTHHPHACLTCAQAEGCPRTQCSTGVPEAERCCSRFGNCELQEVAEYVGIPADTPRYVPAGLQAVTDEPLYERNPELCIACTRCVRACRDLRGVDILEMVVVNGRRVARPRNGQRLTEAQCRFCGACVEVCPTGALLDKGTRSRDELVPCAGACPAGVDIPGYLRLASAGRFDDALGLILARAPLPGVLGHLCPAPCERVCRRDGLGGPAAISALKRACAEYGKVEQALPECGTPSGKRVAVVGAGPAGLTAAVELRRVGHAAVIFDEQERAGGILRSALQSFRLPPEVLDRDVDRVLALGVELRPGVRVGRDVGVEQLLDQHDAVLLAIGAQSARRIDLPGADLEGVYWGLEFLHAAAAGCGPALSGPALVVGGGSVAVDCAMTALRLGAEQAVLCSLESREELPAHPADLQLALEEGVRLMPSWGPSRVVEEDGRVAGLELLRCTAVFDEQGRFSPRFDASRRQIAAGRSVILAVGQAVDRGVLAGVTRLDDRTGPLPGAASDFATGREGLFACGDALSSTTTVVEAIRSGRAAAVAIDRWLGGTGDEAPPDAIGRGPARIDRAEGFATRERVGLASQAADVRRNNWDGVVLGLSPEQAMAEAARCLQCDLRLDLSPAPRPPQRLTPLDAAQLENVPQVAGVYRLYDDERTLYAIAGTADLREALNEKLDSDKAAYFDFEPSEMYTARESELIQQYLAVHGEMPPGEDDLDDLF